jgi:hypothetical protein
MRILIWLSLLAIISTSHAQQYMDTNDPREIKALLSKDNDLNGFGGMDVKVSDVKSTRTLMMGGYGGVLVNRNYMLGIGAYGLVTAPEFDGVLPDATPRDLNLYGGYAGLIIGGTVFTKELVHLSIPVLLGAGNLQVSDHNFFTGAGDNEYIIEQSTFFVIEPAAQLEFNLTRTLRLAAGASYRWVEGINLINVDNNDLIGLTGVLSLKFGRF